MLNSKIFLLDMFRLHILFDLVDLRMGIPNDIGIVFLKFILKIIELSDTDGWNWTKSKIDQKFLNVLENFKCPLNGNVVWLNLMILSTFKASLVPPAVDMKSTSTATEKWQEILAIETKTFL